MLDATRCADDTGYLELGLTWSARTSRLLAYSVDRTGDEVYALRFRDLAPATDLPDEVPRSYYGGAWSADSGHFFYTVHDDAVPAAPGVAAPARHPGRRGRAGARGARRAVRAERARGAAAAASW